MLQPRFTECTKINQKRKPGTSGDVPEVQPWQAKWVGKLTILRIAQSWPYTERTGEHKRCKDTRKTKNQSFYCCWNYAAQQTKYSKKKRLHKQTNLTDYETDVRSNRNTLRDLQRGSWNIFRDRNYVKNEDAEKYDTKKLEEQRENWQWKPFTKYNNKIAQVKRCRTRSNKVQSKHYWTERAGE